MTDIAPTQGSCHCGTVQFTVKLVTGLTRPRRCNCSLCRMRGAIVVSAMRGDLTITQGADALRCYRFNTRVAEHYFCGTCGIYTHHLRRSNPDQLSVNVACLKDVSPFDFRTVPVYEGRVHPNDRTGGYQVAGTLTYEEAPPVSQG